MQATRLARARWPAATQAGSPCQAASAGSARARSKENVTGQGAPSRRTAARLAVARAGLCPPDRNATPATSSGTTHHSAARVCCATISGEASSGLSAPGTTMFALSTTPSSATPMSASSATVTMTAAEVTSRQRADPWAPSIRTSGSTTATSPASWHTRAYRASAYALARSARQDGRPSPIRSTARHVANRAPSATYAASREHSPSSPSVTVSPGAPASGRAPVSTLIPGSSPRSASASGNERPSLTRARNVSSHRMTPLTPRLRPGVVTSISR